MLCLYANSCSFHLKFAGDRRHIPIVPMFWSVILMIVYNTKGIENIAGADNNLRRLRGLIHRGFLRRAIWRSRIYHRGVLLQLNILGQIHIQSAIYTESNVLASLASNSPLTSHRKKATWRAKLGEGTAHILRTWLIPSIICGSTPRRDKQDLTVCARSSRLTSLSLVKHREKYRSMSRLYGHKGKES